MSLFNSKSEGRTDNVRNKHTFSTMPLNATEANLLSDGGANEVLSNMYAYIRQSCNRGFRSVDCNQMLPELTIEKLKENGYAVNVVEYSNTSGYKMKMHQISW